MSAALLQSMTDRWPQLAPSLQHGLIAIDLPPDGVATIVGALKQDFAFDLLLDVTAVDWPQREPRFDVVWHLYSTTHRTRVRLKARVPEGDPAVPSFVPLYGAARFTELECHEMYGIRFAGNEDLRPILLYEGFVGHPLRKDYPKDRAQPLVPYRE